MTTKEAIDHLSDALNSDQEYRVAWVSNIAMAFQDAFANMHRHSGIHEISNVAANNFLDQLCRKPEVVPEPGDTGFHKQTPEAAAFYGGKPRQA